MHKFKPFLATLVFPGGSENVPFHVQHGRGRHPGKRRKRRCVEPNRELAFAHDPFLLDPAKWTPSSGVDLLVSGGPFAQGADGPFDYAAAPTDEGVSAVECGGGTYK